MPEFLKQMFSNTTSIIYLLGAFNLIEFLRFAYIKLFISKKEYISLKRITPIEYLRLISKDSNYTDFKIGNYERSIFLDPGNDLLEIDSSWAYIPILNNVFETAVYVNANRWVKETYVVKIFFYITYYFSIISLILLLSGLEVTYSSIFLLSSLLSISLGVTFDKFFRTSTCKKVIQSLKRFDVLEETEFNILTKISKIWINRNLEFYLSPLIDILELFNKLKEAVKK